MNLLIVKQNGQQEEYSEKKIIASATRVGVPESMQTEMLQVIRTRLFDGISTSDIFDIIKEFFRNSKTPQLASKYNPKQALAELGPSGYLFEKYVAALLTAVGYKTIINVTLNGECVHHEIDVLAEKDSITYPVEVKFHTNPSQRTDIRVALYIWARYKDIESNEKNILLQNGIITYRNYPQIESKQLFSSERRNSIINAARAICDSRR